MRGRERTILGMGAGLTVLLSLGAAAAQPPPAPVVVPPSAPVRPQPYLAPGTGPDSLVILGPPPADGSPQAIADRAAYDDSRSLEGSPRWAQAQADNELIGPKAFQSFSCTVGKAINPSDTPVLSKLLWRSMIDAGGSTAAAKDKYKRTRPLIGNDKAICIAREEWMKTNGSYPSGHAAVGWIWGLILAQLAPEKASALVARGKDFGDSRAVCGVHFPTDVEAGRVMGSATFAALQSNTEFQADLAKAREELAKAPAATGCAGG